MRTFVIGDIHGAYKALLQCLRRSEFNKYNDQLIVLGDVCDGWTEVRQSIDMLLEIENLIYIKGNHDAWFQAWAISGIKEYLWTSQGGAQTIQSYEWQDNVPRSHIDLMVNAPYYYIDDKNRVFVHGGFNKKKPVTEESNSNLMWDRDLFYFMRQQHSSTSEKSYTQYDEIFIGHTQYKQKKPMHFCNLWNLDTAAGWHGYLTIMDVDTKQFWISDCVVDLYPDEKGRR